MNPAPRDFTAKILSEKVMLAAVREGKPGTAMMAFGGRLSEGQIKAVVHYIRTHFMQKQTSNTHYHTVENGWLNHDRYRPAYPFATGTLSVDTSEDRLTEEQKLGRSLYLAVCITCHEQKRSDELVFESRPVSMPRAGYSHRQPDSTPPLDARSGATPYARHDKAPQGDALTPQEALGEQLFQHNCAFCHAADGTGKNWIGQFLQPPARDLTAKALPQRLTTEQLRYTINNGLQNTTMPAWKHVLNAQQVDAIVAYVRKVFFKETKR